MRRENLEMLELLEGANEELLSARVPIHGKRHVFAFPVNRVSTKHDVAFDGLLPQFRFHT